MKLPWAGHLCPRKGVWGSNGKDAWMPMVQQIAKAKLIEMLKAENFWSFLDAQNLFWIGTHMLAQIHAKLLKLVRQCKLLYVWDYISTWELCGQNIMWGIKHAKIIKVLCLM